MVLNKVLKAFGFALKLCYMVPVFLLRYNFGILMGTNAEPGEISNPSHMQAWQVHKYGDDLMLGSVPIPKIKNGYDVLIKIDAISINLIDNYMQDGYGRNFLQVPRWGKRELPLILGRDFCGTIVEKGWGVNNYEIGDKVFGFNNVWEPGSFAEYVVTSADFIQPKPEHLSETESASLVYTSMTAYGALFVNGNLKNIKNKKGLRVLVIGASGGVGTAAVQLLRSQDIFVTGVASTNAGPLIESLGANEFVDYKDPNYFKIIAEKPKYDIILEAANFNIDKVPNDWKFDTFISLNPPLLNNTDNNGLVFGLLQSASWLVQKNFNLLMKGKKVVWGFFSTSKEGFEFVADLINHKKIRPIIYKEYSFLEIPEAVKEFDRGHIRGKVVVNFHK